jgi:hypothetical protein
MPFPYFLGGNYMKIINIGNKDYKFEFTIEASLYNECTEKITNLLFSIEESQSKEDIKQLLSGLSDIPQTTLTMFYAGLLEHHGEEGDGTILTKKDAKALIKQYIDEHKEDDKGNFYEIMNEMIAIMEEDGFFNQIGLTQAAENQAKIPQDHKKKTTRATNK